MRPLALVFGAGFAAQQESVDGQVDEQDGDPQRDLNLARQFFRVQDRDQVPFHESAGVAAGPAHLAQPVFQRRERADPSAEFDRRAPDERRHVEPGDPPPAQDQQAAENNEQDKRQVEEENEVGEEWGECRQGWGLRLVRFHIRPQERVDARLVAASLSLEPIQHVTIQPDGHGRFRLREPKHGSLEEGFTLLRDIGEINLAVLQGVNFGPIGPRGFP